MFCLLFGARGYFFCSECRVLQTTWKNPSVTETSSGRRALHSSQALQKNQISAASLRIFYCPELDMTLKPHSKLIISTPSNKWVFSPPSAPAEVDTQEKPVILLIYFKLSADVETDLNIYELPVTNERGNSFNEWFGIRFLLYFCSTEVKLSLGLQILVAQRGPKIGWNGMKLWVGLLNIYFI